MVYLPRGLLPRLVRAPINPTPTVHPKRSRKYNQWANTQIEVNNKATLIVAKQRHGSTGNVPLLFQSEFTKFTSPNMRDYSDYGFE